MILFPELNQDSHVSLRDQLREAVSQRIFEGVLPLGTRLPSCRALSQQLRVSRNTVLGAYRKLIDDQLIESRERSGYFVCQDLRLARPNEQDGHIGYRGELSNLTAKINCQILPSTLKFIQRPPDWQSYPYPFVCNQIDGDWFPIAEWRECSRLALNKKNLSAWSSHYLYNDCEELITQIRTRLLPRRGGSAQDDEILLTLGAQQALYLAASLFGGAGRRIAVEDPGYPDARNVFNLLFEEVRPIPVDEDGLIVDERLKGCDVVYVTPNRQYPTTVTMSAERRKALLAMATRENMLILEDDYESEADYRERPVAAIYPMDHTGRVIYLGSLSKSLAPGLRIGYMIAQARLIKEARALRGLMILHPPLILQHTAALFIRFGHQEALLSRLHREYERRWHEASKCLDRYFGDFRVSGSFGGTSFLLTGARDLDASRLAALARDEGVVIEPVQPCFAHPDEGGNCFRLGVSSVRYEHIETGIRKLRDVLTEMPGAANGHLTSP